MEELGFTVPLFVNLHSHFLICAQMSINNVNNFKSQTFSFISFSRIFILNISLFSIAKFSARLIWLILPSKAYAVNFKLCSFDKNWFRSANHLWILLASMKITEPSKFWQKNSLMGKNLTLMLQRQEQPKRWRFSMSWWQSWKIFTNGMAKHLLHWWPCRIALTCLFMFVSCYN